MCVSLLSLKHIEKKKRTSARLCIHVDLLESSGGGLWLLGGPSKTELLAPSDVCFVGSFLQPSPFHELHFLHDSSPFDV